MFASVESIANRLLSATNVGDSKIREESCDTIVSTIITHKNFPTFLRSCGSAQNLC
jgi:hypothetical protein